MWSLEKLALYGPRLGWYAINILPEGSVIGQRLEYAGIGSGCGLSQAKAWEIGF